MSVDDFIATVDEFVMAQNAEPVFSEEEHLEVLVEERLVGRRLKVFAITVNHKALFQLTDMLSFAGDSPSYLH